MGGVGFKMRGLRFLELSRGRLDFVLGLETKFLGFRGAGIF